MIIRKSFIAAVCVFLSILCLLFCGGYSLAAQSTAPVVISDTAVFASIQEDTPDRTGVFVSDMVSGNITYSIGSEGIAVTNTDSVHGVWRYFDGAYWRDITGVSDTDALLLSNIRKVIFIPDNNWNGSAYIEYRGWNMTAGADQDRVDTTVCGGDSVFSLGKVTSTVTVTPVNDAPVIVDTFGSRLLEFDGEDDYAFINGQTQFLDSFTIEMWCKWSALNNWSRLFDFGNGEPGDNIWAGVQSTNGILMFETFVGTDYNTKQNIIGQAVPTNQWMHVAAVYDAAHQYAYLYRNGVLEISGAITNPLNAVRNNNYFGRSNWVADDYFKGYMKNIRIWNTVRTPDQIMYGLNKPITGDETGLLAYYPATEGSGDVLCNAAADSTIPDANISGASWIDVSGINSIVSTVENRPEQIDIEIIDADMDDLTVTVASSDQTLILNDRITWSGSGQVRTLILSPNEGQTGTCNITIRANDGTTETAETFGFFVYPNTNGTVSLSSTQYIADENTACVQLAVSRTGGSTGEGSVDYVTQDGTASAGADYSQTTGTIVFADGDTEDKIISISLIDDLTYEGREVFTVRLENAQGGTVIGTREASVTIADNELPGTDASLSALAYCIDGGSNIPIPGFDPMMLEYHITLPETTSQTADITLIPVRSDINASVTANTGVTLTDGIGCATVTVTAEDNTTNSTYTVCFNVTEPSPSPSPTPSPTPTTTPTPTPISTPTPTVTASPTQAPGEDTRTISGMLVDSNNEKVEGYPMQLCSHPITVITDSEGRFTFNNVTYTNHALNVKTSTGELIDSFELMFVEGDQFSKTVTSKGVIITYTSNTVSVEILIALDDEGGAEITDIIGIENPETGSSHTLWILLVAGALILCLAVLFVRKRVCVK